MTTPAKRPRTNGKAAALESCMRAKQTSDCQKGSACGSIARFLQGLLQSDERQERRHEPVDAGFDDDRFFSTITHSLTKTSRTKSRKYPCGKRESEGCCKSHEGDCLLSLDEKRLGLTSHGRTDFVDWSHLSV